MLFSSLPQKASNNTLHLDDNNNTGSSTDRDASIVIRALEGVLCCGRGASIVIRALEGVLCCGIMLRGYMIETHYLPTYLDYTQVLPVEGGGV